MICTKILSMNTLIKMTKKNDMEKKNIKSPIPMNAHLLIDFL